MAKFKKKKGKGQQRFLLQLFHLGGLRYLDPDLNLGFPHCSGHHEKE
jgi:hypothetical protein